MTVEAASDYASRVHKMLSAGVRSDDDLDVAYDSFERQFGVGRWTIEHLRKLKAKTCDVSVFARLKGGYLWLCERQVARLQHEIAITKATDDDADLRDLEAAAAALATKIKARKAALSASRVAVSETDV